PAPLQGGGPDGERGPGQGAAHGDLPAHPRPGGGECGLPGGPRGGPGHPGTPGAGGPGPAPSEEPRAQGSDGGGRLPVGPAAGWVGGGWSAPGGRRTGGAGWRPEARWWRWVGLRWG